MQAIGGYFELELPLHKEYHPISTLRQGADGGEACVRLNTGRNCLEYILRSRQYRKVYIPYYTCEVVLEPFQKLNIEYAFYHIDINLEITDPISLHEDEALLYTNYYGLKQRYVEVLSKKYGTKLIVDNTQAFFAKPLKGIDTFYTCRKFFGVPDGAYLYTDKPLNIEINQDESWERMTFLSKRIDLGAAAGYQDFQEKEELLIGQPIKCMSNLTQRLMQSIDYESAAQQRRRNFLHLHEALHNSNLLKLELADDAVPMVYPYMTNRQGLREHLIKNKVFVARYWPNVLEWASPSDFEYALTSCMLPIPCDQRYSKEDINVILNCIASF